MNAKIMKYQIIKPTNESWDVFGKVLNNLRNESRSFLNRIIQMNWEYSNFSSDYRDKYDKYPKDKDIFGITLAGYIYRDISSKNKYYNTRNLSQLQSEAMSKWKTLYKDILKGDVSVPSYKKDVPIYIHNKSITGLKQDNNNYTVSIGLINNEYKKELGKKANFKFNVLLSARDKTQRTILDRIIDGEYKIGASQIIKKGKKWFLYLTYKFEKDDSILLNKNNIMGIDIGVVNPVYIAFNNNLKRYNIRGGEIEEFRRRVEKRRISLLEQGKYCGEGRIGHGRKRRIKPIEKMSHKVANFRDTVNHRYSKYVVDIALKHNCGVIQMEDLTGISKDNTFLKNWSYYDLQQKIKYKSEEHNIEVRFINPKYTSQRCNKCGHIHKDNRPDQETFECVNCGHKALADFNASRNIAMENIEKIILEQIEVQKQYEEKVKIIESIKSKEKQKAI